MSKKELIEILDETILLTKKLTEQNNAISQIAENSVFYKKAA